MAPGVHACLESCRWIMYGSPWKMGFAGHSTQCVHTYLSIWFNLMTNDACDRRIQCFILQLLISRSEFAVWSNRLWLVLTSPPQHVYSVSSTCYSAIASSIKYTSDIARHLKTGGTNVISQRIHIVVQFNI